MDCLASTRETLRSALEACMEVCATLAGMMQLLRPFAVIDLVVTMVCESVSY